MKDKEKLERVRQCFEDTIWMAIRYADGRHTYAPGMVRDAVKSFQKVFPDWKPKEDFTIEKPTEKETYGFTLKSDYLHDLFEQ